MPRSHLLFLLLSFLFYTEAHADWTRIQKDQVLRVATEGAFKPFNYYEGKKLTGFEVELAELLAKEMALKVEWKAMPFESLLIGLDQDRFDFVIASHGVTAKRAQIVAFSSPHYCTGGIIVSHQGGATKVSDLAGMKIAVQVGTSYYEQLKHKVKDLKPAATVVTFPKDTDALAALLMKRADAWVTDRFVAQEALAKHSDKELVGGEMIFEEQVAIATKKGNDSLLAAINAALIEVQQNGSYKKLSEKYFASDIRCTTNEAKP